MFSGNDKEAKEIKKRRVRSSVKKEIFSKESSVFLISDRELIISGCRKVAEYSDSTVTLRLFDMSLAVEGENLTIKTYFGDEIRLSGRIHDIKILGENDKP